MKSEIHKLLYRLAEIMLQQEQHVLPVDLLFDDAQIGEFVKSIQIDSPYQQLLLEGVLTESVREEKLYVSFTVEGYFHYVLGEVIYELTKNQGANSLKQIAEENNLTGAKKGVEQCLIKDVQQNDLKRLMWLIDRGNDLSNLCSLPLAFSFLNIKGQIKTDLELNSAYKIQINRVLNELLEEPSNNDIAALSKGIDLLDAAQKNGVLAILFRKIHEMILPDNINKMALFIKTVEYIPEENRKKNLLNLAKFQISEENGVTASFYHSLGQQFNFIGEYEKAIEYLEKSLAINFKIYGPQNDSIGTLYTNLGSVWRDKGDLNKAIEYNEKSIAIRLKAHGNLHSSIGKSYNNLGWAWNLKGDYNKAIKYLEKSLLIRLKVHGGQHPSTGESYYNLGLVLHDKGDFNKAIEYLEKALEINLRIHNCEDDFIRELYNNLGSVWLDSGKYDNALEYFEKSLNINLRILGKLHPETAYSYFLVGNCLHEQKKYEKAIEYYLNAIKIKQKGTFLFRIAQCYEAISIESSALHYYLESAEIRKNDSECGIDDSSTFESAKNALRLAKILNQEELIPSWINELKE